MTSFDFEVSEFQRDTLLAKFPNLGKNSDVGKYSIEVVKLFFLSRDSKTLFCLGKSGADLEVKHGTKYEQFEIKGNTDSEVRFQKLKVSNQYYKDYL